MKKDTKTVWYADDNRELIVSRSDGEYTIVPSSLSRAHLRELGEAIQDALSEPLVSEIRQANRKAASVKEDPAF